MDTKKVVISGWYGNKNVGDEAQLSSMINMINRVLPDAEITVFSDDPATTISEHNVNSIKKGRCTSLRVVREMAKADLFILGGGTLLYDTGEGAGAIIQRLNYVILAKLMGTPVMYFNGGVGLIYNRLSIYYMRHVCNTMDLITVRDKMSERNLRSLGITKPVHIGADSVFALTKQSIAEAKGHEKHTRTEKPKVGVNVRSWLYPLEDIPPKSHAQCKDFGGSFLDFVNFRKDIAGAIDYLKQEKDASIIFFPISFLKVKGDYDVQLSEEIVHLSNNWDDITIIRNECTYGEMINQMKEFDLVIGMRLHALVFAAVLNIPMLAISYDSKVNAFMKLIGQEEYLVNINEVTEDVLHKKINQLWECREAVAKEIEERIPKLASDSEKSAELMSNVLSTPISKLRLVFEGAMLAIIVLPCIPFRTLQMLFRIIRLPLPFWLKISSLLRTLRLKIPKTRKEE